MSTYVGRFAPSPTGQLHAGSLVAALASWLDARAHDGQWLIRIEDVDAPALRAGRRSDHPGSVGDVRSACRTPRRSTKAGGQRLYREALDRLIASGHAYPCGCTRADIAQANEALGRVKPRHGDLVYPGTCRPANGGLHGKPARAWRLQVPEAPHDLITWHDRRLGESKPAPRHRRG
ncbi:MAG: glutamate--tRNA ligase family protein [Aquabacterium sp.]